MESKDELVFGEKPLCNFFQSSKANNTDLYGLAIGECCSCGLVQLTQYPSAYSIAPKHSWLRYNEPDTHLIEVSKYINSINTENVLKVLGLGPFEKPLMDLLNTKYEKKQVNILKYISIPEDRYPYLEAYQSVSSGNVVAKIKNDFGTADLVICRYLLEHCDKPVKMLQSLSYLLNAGGSLLIEIPDSKKFLESCDYSFIWEEHLLYFTDTTLRLLVKIAGFQIIKSFRFPGALEDALVYILKPILKKEITNAISIQYKKNLFQKYKTNFNSTNKNYHEALELLVRNGKKIALFGAGHQAIMFINLFKLDRYLTCIIDDDANKIGTFFPGTDLKIHSTKDAFNSDKIDIILLAVTPKIELKIIKKIKESYNNKCKIYSIFEKSDLCTLIRK